MCRSYESALAMDQSHPEAASEPGPDIAALRAAIASGDPARAMPALARLREVSEDRAIPLLLLGLEQTTFMVRSLACAGLGVKRNETGRQALERSLRSDSDANVRAEAANALASHGVEQAWPLLRSAFEADDHWLVRCSILSALAEHPQMDPERLLDLAELALRDGRWQRAGGGRRDPWPSGAGGWQRPDPDLRGRGSPALATGQVAADGTPERSGPPGGGGGPRWSAGLNPAHTAGSPPITALLGWLCH